MSRKIGVVLSGCGVMDGSEIHEAVLTLLALDRAGAKAVCMAPDIEQSDVVDHAAGKPASETRRVLVEAARIARGEIRNVADVKEGDVDALVFPGGFGAAKNLCDFARNGSDAKVNPDVARLARDVHKAGKPLGAICIAPALVAALFRGEKQVELTIGNDAGTAAKLEAMGARHVIRKVDEIHVDRKNKLVTTPAYMLARSIGEAATGIEKLVKAVLDLT